MQYPINLIERNATMTDRTEQNSPRRRPRTRTIVITSAAIVVACSTVSALVIAPWVEGRTASAPAHDPAIQRELDGLVTDTGFPAALAAVTDAGGAVTDYVSGVGEIGTDKKVPADGQVRIGSNTKMYTAAVMLQLVDEGKVALDEPVATYLPGLLEAHDIDGESISVRQLLQHTSGLPNYTGAIVEDMSALRDTYLSPRDLVDLAFTLPVSFAPGERWEYSNTNYVLAGLIIEKVTGRPIGPEITDRIIDPLGLTETSFPGLGDTSIPGPHATGYYAGLGEDLEDYTKLDPSWGWAAGQMISSPSDLNRFMRALIDGDVISDVSLEEMQSTVPAEDPWTGAEYGLGLMSYPLSCGGLAWGHGGDIPGYETRNAVVPDGDAVTIAVTTLPGSLAKDEPDAYRIAGEVTDALDAALCAG